MDQKMQVPKKKLGLKTIRQLKNLKSKKKLGSVKIRIPGFRKKLWSEKKMGSKKYYGLKKFMVQKFRVRNLGSKKIGVQKHLVSGKKWGSKKLRCNFSSVCNKVFI